MATAQYNINTEVYKIDKTTERTTNIKRRRTTTTTKRKRKK